MTTIQINTVPSSLSIFNSSNTVFEICVGIDLQNVTVYMGNNTVLRFINGSFSNGNIRGNESFVESSGNDEVFNNVSLEGQWRGYIHDRMFYYDDEHHADFTPILSSLLCFEKIDLFRKEYYLQWNRIGVDTPQDIEMDGHGAIWYISSNKGDVDPWNATTNPWGPKYESWVLISYYYYVRKVFRVRNLIIEDNSQTSGIEGYGEVMDYSHVPETGTGDPNCNTFPIISCIRYLKASHHALPNLTM